MKERFRTLLQELNLALSDKQWNQFEQYYTLLTTWNNKVNLTAITEYEEVYLKHFYDSLCIVKGIDVSTLDTFKLLDVGSGAGFPSIPLKIMFPNLSITIIDALQKRITFLEELIKELGIDAYLIHGRAEEHERKNAYDIVTARAVANARVLTELCLPFVRVGGTYISLKGSRHEEERIESMNAIKVLGGSYLKTIEYQIANENRALIVVEKTHKTEKGYPRKFSKIKKSPL